MTRLRYILRIENYFGHTRFFYSQRALVAWSHLLNSKSQRVSLPQRLLFPESSGAYWRLDFSSILLGRFNLKGLV